MPWLDWKDADRGRIRAPTAGIILAGGLARRMGGGDKLLLRVGAVPVLERLLESLTPQCESLVLNANGDGSRFAGFGLPIVEDDVAGNPGPLAGIVAALDRVAAEWPRCRWALTIAGDTPFPPRDLVERLHTAREAAGADLAMAASGGRVHPVIALWPVAARRAMRAFLVEEGQRRVRAFAERYRFALADWPTDPHDPFLNVNTPHDLAMAEAVARELGRKSFIEASASAAGT